MKQLIKRIIEIILILTIIILIGIWIVPWKKKVISFKEKTDLSESAEYIIKSQKIEANSVAPEKIASLFGWEKTYKINNSVKKNQETPEVAIWLKPLGFIVSSDGKKFYFLKNNKTNRVLQLTENNVDDGWKLIEIANDELLLEFEGKKYIVRND